VDIRSATWRLLAKVLKLHQAKGYVRLVTIDYGMAQKTPPLGGVTIAQWCVKLHPFASSEVAVPRSFHIEFNKY